MTASDVWIAGALAGVTGGLVTLAWVGWTWATRGFGR